MAFDKESSPSVRRDWHAIQKGPNFKDSLVQDRIEYAIRYIDWYRKKKNRLQVFSKILRVLAIIFISLGSISPLIAKMHPVFDPYYGYVLLAIGGSMLLADRVFGLSAGWSRFMVAALELEALTESFKIKIIGEIEKDDQQFLQLCLEFTQGVSEIVGAETKIWVSEFNSGREELAGLVKDRKS